MTEEELADIAETAEIFAKDNTISGVALSDLSYNSLHIQLLCTLLQGKSVTDILKANHLMPSVIADEINEELFDEFGDSIISCEDDRLTLVEDYREELAFLLEETV